MFEVFPFLHQLLLFGILRAHKHLQLPKKPRGILQVRNTWEKEENVLPRFKMEKPSMFSAIMNLH